MFRYWKAVVVSAHKATVDQLFGDIRRGLLQLALALFATSLLAFSGRDGEATDQFHWLGATGAVAVTFYLVILFYFLLKIPARNARRQENLIAQLNEQTGYQNVPTFKVTVEKVPENDADRSIFDTELIYRIGIKNLSVRVTLDAYVILEGLPDSLGVSPAAKLSPLGRDAGQFSIAPTETVYVRFIERYALSGNPMLSFAAHTSAESVSVKAMTGLMREYSRVGELEPGKDYEGAIVVLAKDALTSRTRFTVSIDPEGEPNVATQ